MDFNGIQISTFGLSQLFLSIGSLLILSHFFGRVFNFFHLPRVIGEIFSGIVLGPSLLGYISPETYSTLFNSLPGQDKIIAFLYWLGLILLMLCAGFKIKSTSNAEDKNIIINLIISSTCLPILGGLLYYQLYDFTPYKGILGTDFSLSIIVCISIAITSIPVISKIFIDLDIINSRFAKIILVTATFHDLILWVALDVAIKDTSNQIINIYLNMLTTILFILFTFIFGPYLGNMIKSLHKKIISNYLSIIYIFSFCSFMLIVSHFLEINIIFGALMAGIIIGTFSERDFQFAKKSISNISLTFFIPLYFAIVGLKINLPAYFDWKLFLSFLLISSFLEIGSVLVGLRLLSKDWLTNLNFGFAMNTRGGPGIVIASMAYEFSIINEKFFVVLVLVAMTTSLVSGTWFRFILSRRGFLYAT